MVRQRWFGSHGAQDARQNGLPRIAACIAGQRRDCVCVRTCESRGGRGPVCPAQGPGGGREGGGRSKSAGGAVSSDSDRSSRAVLDMRRQAPLFHSLPSPHKHRHKHAAFSASASLHARVHPAVGPPSHPRLLTHCSLGLGPPAPWKGKFQAFPPGKTAQCSNVSPAAPSTTCPSDCFADEIHIYTDTSAPSQAPSRTSWAESRRATTLLLPTPTARRTARRPRL